MTETEGLIHRPCSIECENLLLLHIRVSEGMYSDALFEIYMDMNLVRSREGPIIYSINDNSHTLARGASPRTGVSGDRTAP